MASLNGALHPSGSYTMFVLIFDTILVSCLVYLASLRIETNRNKKAENMQQMNKKRISSKIISPPAKKQSPHHPPG